MTVIHCLSHQKGREPEAQGSQMADAAAKQAAQGLMALAGKSGPSSVTHSNCIVCQKQAAQETAVLVGGGKPLPRPLQVACQKEEYDIRELIWTANQLPYFSQEHIELSAEKGREFVQKLHQFTHLGVDKLLKLIENSRYRIQGLNTVIQQVVESCQVCKKQEKRRRGDHPGAY